MIFCYSGTGNSALVARELQSHLGGEIVMLEGRMLENPSGDVVVVPEGEPVVWVFPVYSWGVPPVLVPFLRRCKLKMEPEHATPHFMVCTCGDDTGYADHQWAKIVGRRGWNPRGAFSVTMPNTYVLMKGFNVDTPELAAGKLAAMPARVAHIAGKIRKGYGEGEMTRGSWAWLKTYVVYPWFVAFCMSPKPFHAADACTSCGLCARSCPLGNISMTGGRPEWGARCALCLRCYHGCPVHAVAYGDATGSKGQKEVYRIGSDEE